MHSIQPGGLAVVVGATGGIGGAFAKALRQDAGFAQVVALSRRGQPPLDLMDEASIAAAAMYLRGLGAPLRLVVVASGFLHGGGMMPEKSLAALDPAALAQAFAVNATGPAMLMKHLLPLLPRQGKAVFAALSAKVGSIGDNRAGGWYGYRAAKAALNQLIHTAAIELQRRCPEALCVALHPGTVATALSAPFAKSGLTVRLPDVAAAEMLAVLDGLTAPQTGLFFDYTGAVLPW